MINTFTVEIYEYEGKLFIFPTSETNAAHFYELPSLKISYDSTALEIGKTVLEASKKVRDYEFEHCPFSKEEEYTDIGVKSWITFINKSRFCSLSLCDGDEKIDIYPGYRSAGGFEFGDGLFATPDDPQDIGEKVLQALKTYEPKYPKNKSK